MPWTNDIPDELRERLEPVLSQRRVGAAEVWGTLKEFLEEIGVEPPAVPNVNQPESQR